MKNVDPDQTPHKKLSSGQSILLLLKEGTVLSRWKTEKGTQSICHTQLRRLISTLVIYYANIVWGSTSQTNLMQIEILQKRACRIILNYNIDNVYQSMNDLKIMSVSERIFFRKAKFMFKVSNGFTPVYINSMFTKC